MSDEIGKLASKLEALRFEVEVLNIDKGVFQKVLLENWQTIKSALESEARRRKGISVVQGVKPT